MSNFNKTLLMGNLTRDIETRTTQGGTVIGKFGIAINRKSKDRETTCFVDCTAFGKSAEILAKYCSKGSPLFVEGRLEYSSWEDNGGNRRNKLEVVVENFQLMRSDDSGERKGQRSGGGREDKTSEPDYGEVPF